MFTERNSFLLLSYTTSPHSNSNLAEAESKEKHCIWDPICAGVDYNLTLCPPQSRLQHIYDGQPYAGVDFILQSGPLDLAYGDIIVTCVRQTRFP